MNTNPERFQEIVLRFPQLKNILKRLDDAKVFYNLSGSAAMYIQGNSRLPNDIDVMFTEASHQEANKVFGLSSEVIERPNVSMVKSSPVDDNSVDFLSNYAAIADGRVYCTPPLEVAQVEYEGRKINLVPAEMIAVFKLIGRREHHNDSGDFKDLYAHPDFNKTLFWKVVDLLDARPVVTALLSHYGLN
jgi:hypothetical protein